jgi:hypothetical protein
VIPILVGGTSGRAPRRAANLGDGWIPDATVDRVDFEALARRKDELAELRQAAGRADAPFQHVLVVDGAPDRPDGLTRAARGAGELGFDEVVIEVPFEEPSRARAIVTEVRSAIGD